MRLFVEQDLGWLENCSNAGSYTQDVTAGFGANYCIAAARARISALRAARDLQEEAWQHQEIMQRYEDGEVTARQRDDAGAPSLAAGIRAAGAFRQAEDEADTLIRDCR